MGDAERGVLHVEVVYCPAPGSVDQVQLVLPAGATLLDALDASGLRQRHALGAGASGGELRLGIWGRMQPPNTGLRDRDRIELYRALKVDPKEARRLRYKGAKTGAKTGAKSGTKIGVKDGAKRGA